MAGEGKRRERRPKTKEGNVMNREEKKRKVAAASATKLLGTAARRHQRRCGE
jgi:hypothetical protein